MRRQGHRPHAWDVSTAQAREIQAELRDRVITTDSLGPVASVGGLDIGFADRGRTTRAAVVVLSFPELQLVSSHVVERATTFPYVPGLLSFREIPAALEALAGLARPPDLLLCDGQGYAHPRRLGLASHLGVFTGLATIGVAKSRLIGTHAPVPEEKGCWVPLEDAEETIGAVLRTRRGVKPLYVSIGHRISLETAIDYVMACVTRYRLPETTRWAHRLASG